MLVIFLLNDVIVSVVYFISSRNNFVFLGMVWSSCTVIKDRLVSRVTQVEILHHKSTSLTVRWSLDCRDQAGIVYGYRYTRVQLHEHRQTIKRTT